MELTGYGRSTGFCVDPIEKKPLNHFLPGSAVLSFGTAGCNLACAFCQNWDISKSRETARLSAVATPETIARAAERLGCASVAYTYNDPTIFLEYAVDTAEACRARGVKNVAVTAGFICEEPRKRLFARDGRGQRRSQGLHRALLREALRGQARAGARDAEISRPRDERLDRDHHAPDPRRERRRRGARRADANGWRRSSSPTCRCTSPPSTPTTTCAKRRPTPLATLAAGARDRARRTACITSTSATSATRRGRRRSARPAGRAASAATATRSPSTGSTPAGRCPGCGTPNGRRVRRPAGDLGIAAPAGGDRALRGVKS